MDLVKKLLRKFSHPPRRARTDEREAAQRTLLVSNLKRFQKIIGYSIRNQGLFVQALLHRSFLQRMNHPRHSNERLEFLGDSILNLIIAEYLYQHFPTAEEGELTKRRSRLVNRRALAAFAKDISLPDFILMSPSAAQSIGKGGDTIIADTYEALVAAIYLDGGYDNAKKFVRRQVQAALKKGLVLTADQNYKSMLLEYAQANGLGVPRYNIVKQEGPDHDRTFTVEVLMNDSRKGSGSGKNKKEAEQAAASKALEKLR